ncbi:MAG: hypothetical protein LBB65_06010, partial [Burkholderiales bacterium]|nr:hypothetical protein [Burkholderiales bacterium]
KAEGRRTAEGWFRAAECGEAAQNPCGKRNQFFSIVTMKIQTYNYSQAHDEHFFSNLTAEN